MDLERYEMLGSLAQQGGMSDIILGRDKQTNDQVVIKFLSKDALDDSKRRARFERETETALVVQHSHVLRAIGNGEGKHNGYVVPFIVYPYIVGGSLQKLLTESEPWKSWTLLH
jgi:serine/threonine protein kinase